MERELVLRGILNQLPGDIVERDILLQGERRLSGVRLKRGWECATLGDPGEGAPVLDERRHDELPTAPDGFLHLAQQFPRGTFLIEEIEDFVHPVGVLQALDHVGC